MIVVCKYILELIFNIMLILACLAMSYAALSGLIQTIRKDFLKKREIDRLLKENVKLREEIERLKIELVDKGLAKEYNDDKRTKN